nr:MAG: hypothetical protein [Picobirnavirus sp.]
MQRANMAQEALTRYRDQSTVALRSSELIETSRSNQAKESETARHNRAVEQQALVDLGIKQYGAETARLSQQETARSNLARETETHRANVAQETETARANRAREAETHRSNVANEGIGWYNASTNRVNAQTNAYNAETNRLAQQETARANLVREAQNHASLIQGASNITLTAERNRIAQQDADTKRMEAETHANTAAAQINLWATQGDLNKAKTAESESVKKYTDTKNFTELNYMTQGWLDSFTKLLYGNKGLFGFD